jgi:hypothetical protein
VFCSAGTANTALYKAHIATRLWKEITVYFLGHLFVSGSVAHTPAWLARDQGVLTVLTVGQGRGLSSAATKVLCT